LQILEALAALAAAALVLVDRPGGEVGLALLLLYLVQVGEFFIELGQRRRGPEPIGRGVFLYLLPGCVALRRIVEFTAATLLVRVPLVLLILLTLLTLPVTLLSRGDRLGNVLGRLHDSSERALEPLLDLLLRGYNAVSLNRHPPGETGLVLAVPMPFRERLL
jgi:hypothetical protein